MTSHVHDRESFNVHVNKDSFAHLNSSPMLDLDTICFEVELVLALLGLVH
jgi:hypothetical protein